MRHEKILNSEDLLCIRTQHGPGPHSIACGVLNHSVSHFRTASGPPISNTMTFEEVLVHKSEETLHFAGKTLEDVLVTAKNNDCLTVGVYESAKVMNVDPDSVCFCVLAADEEYECDIALQIHFTLIQAFCFDNDINIVRVTDPQRLARVAGHESGDVEDAHCVLITNPAEGSWEDPALEKLHLFCEESRSVNEWVPEISLPER